MSENHATSVLRVEDPHLLLGDTTFVADLDLPDAAVVTYVTSVMAHAEITNIDVSEALEAPGVLAVVTARDLAAADMGPVPGHLAMFPASTERSVLADTVARFVGEPIVAIVAESHAAAADATELVFVDYEPLSPVVGFDAALSDATVIYPEHGSNTIYNDHGGADTPFVADEVVVEATIANQRLAPCPIETRVAAAWWDGDRLVHHASCQGVHPHRAMLAAWYGMEKEQIRVTTADVGGSFGAKARMYPEEMLLGFLAKMVGRPVRWTPTRSQDMTGLGHSRNQRQEVKITGRRDGTITAIDAHIITDCGAYPIAAAHMAKNTGVMLPGPLAVDQVTWRTTAVVTNTTPIVAYRGAGRPEAGALLDRAVDLFAAEIGMDPIEVRRSNLVPASAMPHTNPSDVVYDSGDYPLILEQLAGHVGYDAIRSQQAAQRSSGSTKHLGIGLSVFIDRTAGVIGSEYGSLELNADGSMRVLTGSSPYGQGHYTTWSQLVSERTGVPIEQIEVFHGDTDVVPRGGITGGSRSAQKAGSAVAVATDQLVAEAAKFAADMLEAAPGDVVIDTATGQFHVAGSPGAASVGWVEIAAARVEAAKADGDDGQIAFACETDFEPDGPSVPYGAYAAVVEVDAETGAIDLQRMVSVDDAGIMINETIVRGQVHGGIGQAIGQALYEEFVYDEDGNPITSNFMDYGIPGPTEMPSFESHLTETPSPNNPLGAKGIAESGTIGAVPAIQNAVVDALSHLGVRHIDLPVTPQRVWTALRS